MPNTNDSLTGLNVELVGASKQEFTLLTENHLMRRIIVALSELMRNAEGVMIDSHVYPWDQVLPAAMDIPSSNASDEEIQNWMISACKVRIQSPGSVVYRIRSKKQKRHRER